ncbi:MAG: alpha/beta fold hydrolase [Sphingomonas sp.]|nr:alpha/beta fold hydrolase [Sphingomonas sp.]
MITSKVAWQGDDRPPSLRLRLGEAAWLLPRMWRAFGSTRPIGPVDGPPALVIPGFVAHDRTTMALRRALAEAGWRVHGWELGLNLGVRADTVARLRKRLDEIGHHQPILVVGWSLGGLFARELARAVPDRVRAVVTLGSPFSGDPKQNNVWRLYQLIAGHKVDETPIPRITDKPPVPQLALWSRKDGLIAPRAARGLEHERDKAVELDCTHMAFGVSSRAASDVVREIQTFLEEQKLAPESRH